MKRLYRLKYFLFFCFSVLASSVSAQTGDIQFIGANSIDFHINSIDRIHNGQSFTDWVWLQIDYTDAGINKWDLFFKAEDVNLSNGTNNIPNSVINITVSSVVGAAYNAIFSNVNMNNTEQILVDHADGGNNIEVYLTITCDDPDTFISSENDYYNGIIRFVLRESL